MSRVALITDIDTSLGNELVRLYLEAGNRVVATSSTEETVTSLDEVAEDSLTVVRWNRRSPVSARNVLLKTLAAYDRMDDLLLLGPPEAGGLPLLQVDLVEIEDEVDTWVKGSLFLIREGLTHFEKRRTGLMALVGQTGSDRGSPLAVGVRSAFDGLTRSLLTEYARRTAPLVNGFSSGGKDAESYAAFVVRSLDEKGRETSGKWFRHQGGLLSGLKSGRR